MVKMMCFYEDFPGLIRQVAWYLGVTLMYIHKQLIKQ